MARYTVCSKASNLLQKAFYMVLFPLNYSLGTRHRAFLRNADCRYSMCVNEANPKQEKTPSTSTISVHASVRKTAFPTCSVPLAWLMAGFVHTPDMVHHFPTKKKSKSARHSRYELVKTWKGETRSFENQDQVGKVEQKKAVGWVLTNKIIKYVCGLAGCEST